MISYLKSHYPNTKLFFPYVNSSNYKASIINKSSYIFLNNCVKKDKNKLIFNGSYLLFNNFKNDRNFIINNFKNDGNQNRIKPKKNVDTAFLFPQM